MDIAEVFMKREKEKKKISVIIKDVDSVLNFTWSTFLRNYYYYK